MSALQSLSTPLKFISVPIQSHEIYTVTTLQSCMLLQGRLKFNYWNASHIFKSDVIFWLCLPWSSRALWLDVKCSRIVNIQGMFSRFMCLTEANICAFPWFHVHRLQCSQAMVLFKNNNNKTVHIFLQSSEIGSPDDLKNIHCSHRDWTETLQP